jgi:hypothetical protein
MPPLATVGEVGLTATEVRLLAGFVMVIMAEAVLVDPLSVALTKMPTVPVMLPAVKFTGVPVAALSEPMAPLVSVHAHMIPDLGHVALHVGVAVKTCMVPIGAVGAVGLTATEEMVTVAALTVRVAVEVTEWPAESLTKTRTVNTPEAEGTQVSEVTLEEMHPPGRPV